jgi:membrane fusion protein (multidrug efflux system)
MHELCRHVLVGVTAAATAVGAAGCTKGDASAARARPPPLVVVAKVAARDVPVEVRAPVDLRPLEQADVGSKTLGVLDAVTVDRGDHVKRGQLLALVRPSDLPDQLAAARGTLAQTQASLALARTNFDRANSLAPSGVVSQQELQSSSAALATAEATQAAAQAQVSALAVRLGETRIDSPMTGVVVVRKLDPGAMVGLLSGATIVTVARIDVLRVFVTVTEQDIPKVHVGQQARVEIDALPGSSYQGQVVRIAPSVDPATRTLDAEVKLNNAKEELHPGMFGHGAIVVDTHVHAPVIPATSVQTSNLKSYVYVVTGDRVQRRAIRIGVDGGTWVEAADGLTPGDEIVTAGIDGLSDGIQVRVTRDVDPYSGGSVATPDPSLRSGVRAVAGPAASGAPAKPADAKD